MFKVGDTIYLSLLYQVNGVTQPGLTNLSVKIFELSSDTEILNSPLSESTENPGLYEYDWDTTGLTNNSSYLVVYLEDSDIIGKEKYYLQEDVVDYSSIAAAVWDETAANHEIADTFGEKIKQIIDNVTFILNIESGNWTINNNQMIFYDRNGLEILRYNLLNKNDQLTEKEVFKRVKV